MFKRINKIDDVYKFFLYRQELVYSKELEDGNCTLTKMDLSTQQVTTTITTESTITTSIPLDDGFLAQSSDGNAWLMKPSLETITKIPEPLKVILNNNYIYDINDLLPVYQGDFFNIENGIYDISKSELLWVSDEINKLEVFGDYAFGQTKFTLYRADIKTGEIIWEWDFKIDYPKLADLKVGIIKPLGVRNNLLFVGVEKIDRLFAFDIETGEMKWEHTCFPSTYKLDPIKDRLHSITAGYNGVSIENGKIINTFRNREYFEEVGILCNRNNYAIMGDHLITTDKARGNIGAYNTLTGKFDWLLSEEGVSYPAPRPIFYDASHLVLQDSKNSLHIFKRTD